MSVHRSALVLLAPRVHASLYDLRARHLRNLGRKMPSHVTVLFPFRNPVDEEAAARRSSGSAPTTTPFTATFAEVRALRQQRRVAAARNRPQRFNG